MTTAQMVFDTAISIMDELDDRGRSDNSDNKEYKDRTLAILNMLRGELFPYSDTYKIVEAGKRPIVKIIENFEEEIGLDDYICQTILPYGLAAHLLLDENPANANFCQQRYDELKRDLSRGLPTESVDIEDVYSNRGYYDEFGVWHKVNGNGIGFEWTTHW